MSRRSLSEDGRLRNPASPGLDGDQLIVSHDQTPIRLYGALRDQLLIRRDYAFFVISSLVSILTNHLTSIQEVPHEKTPQNVSISPLTEFGFSVRGY